MASALREDDVEEDSNSYSTPTLTPSHYAYIYILCSRLGFLVSYPLLVEESDTIHAQ